MIVRILGEGQFNLPGAVIDDLNDIDNRMVEAVAAEDGVQFQSLLDEMFPAGAGPGRAAAAGSIGRIGPHPA